MLLEFAASFHARLVGLTGTQAEIAAAAGAVGVKYSKVLQGDDYTVDHSSSYSLIDPERRNVVTFKRAEPHMVAAKIIEVLEGSGLRLDGVNSLRAAR